MFFETPYLADMLLLLILCSRSEGIPILEVNGKIVLGAEFWKRMYGSGAHGTLLSIIIKMVKHTRLFPLRSMK